MPLDAGQRRQWHLNSSREPQLNIRLGHTRVERQAARFHHLFGCLYQLNRRLRRDEDSGIHGGRSPLLTHWNTLLSELLRDQETERCRVGNLNCPTHRLPQTEFSFENPRCLFSGLRADRCLLQGDQYPMRWRYHPSKNRTAQRKQGLQDLQRAIQFRVLR